MQSIIYIIVCHSWKCERGRHCSLLLTRLPAELSLQTKSVRFWARTHWTVNREQRQCEHGYWFTSIINFLASLLHIVLKCAVREGRSCNKSLYWCWCPQPTIPRQCLPRTQTPHWLLLSVFSPELPGFFCVNTRHWLERLWYSNQHSAAGQGDGTNIITQTTISWLHIPPRIHYFSQKCILFSHLFFRCKIIII